MRKIIPLGSIIFILFVFCVQKANALSCKLTSDNTVTETVELSTLVFLSGASNGDIVWYSPVYSRNVTCTSNIQEDVYVYPYPKSDEVIPTGVEMGLIFDNTDYGIIDPKGSSTSNRQQIKISVSKNNPGTKDITFQAYMKKKGDIDTSSTSSMTLFQLDGAGGLNNIKDSNYNLNITGWDNSGTIDCSSTLSGTSFNLSSVDTDKAFSGESSANIDNASVSISCTSSSESILNLVKYVTGDFKIAGTASSDNNAYFSTDSDKLGLAAYYDSSVISPGDSVSMIIPVSSGKGNKTLSLSIQPRLFSLELSNPSWLFNGTENTASGTLDFSFTPRSVNTE